MKYADIVITPPPTKDSGQYYIASCRTYYVTRDADGATLHPVDGHTVSHSTGDLVSVTVAFESPHPGKRGIRNITAKELLRGDIIGAQWPVSQDAVQFRSLGEWQYSPVASEDIRLNRLPAHYTM